MMNDPKLFRLTEQDKLRYLKLIEKINPMHKNHIVLVLGEKNSKPFKRKKSKYY